MAKNKNHFYAIWLVLACIIFFILQNLITGFTDALLLNESALIEPWRFISAIFLHGSLTHLVYNLFALGLFGLILESIIGSRKFLLVFFVSGILANFLASPFYNSSLGASGAIMGIIGCLTFIKPKMTVWAFSLPMPLFLAAFFWVAGDIFGVFIPDNVGHIAHLSGIAFGLILGIVFRTQIKIKERQNYKLELPERQIQVWEDTYMR